MTQNVFVFLCDCEWVDDCCSAGKSRAKAQGWSRATPNLCSLFSVSLPLSPTLTLTHTSWRLNSSRPTGGKPKCQERNNFMLNSMLTWMHSCRNNWFSFWNRWVLCSGVWCWVFVAIYISGHSPVMIQLSTQHNCTEPSSFVLFYIPLPSISLFHWMQCTPNLPVLVLAKQEVEI